MKKYDVIIIGGGPAGATTAALVAEQGHNVLVLERDHFPRFRIGESLMPGTYWTLKRLGVLQQMKNSAFPKKYSVQFYNRSGKAAAPFYFSENEEGDCSQTWQVLRSEFDELMLANARSKGAEVKHGVHVIDVVFEDDVAVGVHARQADKRTVRYDANIIVDASGQSALISRKLKISHPEPKMRNAAIYTHFKGALRDSGIDEGATVIYHTREQHSWFWFIPLPGDVVSVGVVGRIDYLLNKGRRDAQDIFTEELQICPALMPRLAAAKPLFPVKTTKEFSFKAEQMAGNGWVLIGDAFGFLDPIYSSGIFLALKSGEMAADTIIQAIDKKDFSKQQLMTFAPEFLRGMEAIRKLVYAFYSRDFSFARFLKQFPQCRKDIVNILVGNVFRTSVNGLFEHLGKFAELPDDVSLR